MWHVSLEYARGDDNNLHCLAASPEPVRLLCPLLLAEFLGVFVGPVCSTCVSPASLHMRSVLQNQNHNQQTETQTKNAQKHDRTCCQRHLACCCYMCFCVQNLAGVPVCCAKSVGMGLTAAWQSLQIDCPNAKPHGTYADQVTPLPSSTMSTDSTAVPVTTPPSKKQVQKMTKEIVWRCLSQWDSWLGLNIGPRGRAGIWRNKFETVRCSALLEALHEADMLEQTKTPNPGQSRSVVGILKCSRSAPRV